MTRREEMERLCEELHMRCLDLEACEERPPYEERCLYHRTAAALRETWERMEVAETKLRGCQDALIETMNEYVALLEQHNRLREACVTPSYQMVNGVQHNYWQCEVCWADWDGEKWPGSHKPTCPLADDTQSPEQPASAEGKGGVHGDGT